MDDKDFANTPYTLSYGARPDLFSLKRITRWIERFGQGGASECIVDMTSIEVLDSTRFSSVISAVRQLYGAGVRVTVLCKDAAVRKLFETTGVTRMVELIEQVESRALAS
jgi:anti-anti-sigma factor